MTWLGSKTLTGRESHERRASTITQFPLERPVRCCHRRTLPLGWDRRSSTPPAGSNACCVLLPTFDGTFPSVDARRVDVSRTRCPGAPIRSPSNRSPRTYPQGERVCSCALLVPRRRRCRLRLGPCGPRNSAACAFPSSTSNATEVTSETKSGRAKAAASDHRSGRRHGACVPARTEDLAIAHRSCAKPTSMAETSYEGCAKRASSGVRTRHA